MFYRSSVTILITVTACLLTACAITPSVSLNTSDRTAIKNVNVVSEVKLPTDIYLQDRAQAVTTGVGGVLGYFIGQSLAKEPKAQLLTVMQANNISISDILKREFQKIASQKTAINFAEGLSSADADLTLTINNYGYGQTHGFSVLYPILAVTAVIKRADGTIVWQQTDDATAYNEENNEGHEFVQYLENPKHINSTLTKISDIVSTMLVNRHVAL